MGFGLLAGPLVLLVWPGLVPGPLLAVSLVALVPVVWRERAALQLVALRGALVAAVPGAFAGLLLLRALDQRALSLVVAVVVLVACAATAVGLRLPSGPGALAGAGLLAGAMSTVAATPGPPIVLTYRAPSPAAQRANLSLFFVVTTLFSLAVLLAGGEFTGTDAGSAALLAPFVVAGLVVAEPARRRLDLALVRRSALALCAGSGAVLLVSTLLGG
jgi:uncharacterized protein